MITTIPQRIAGEKGLKFLWHLPKKIEEGRLKGMTRLCWNEGQGLKYDQNKAPKRRQKRPGEVV